MGTPCGLTPIVIMGVGDFVANPLVTYNQENSFGDSKQPAQKMEIAMVVHFAHFLHK